MGIVAQQTRVFPSKARLSLWIGHLALHHDCLPGQLLPGPGHPQQPGYPLEEQHPHPVRHLVSVSLPVIGQLLVKLCSDWLIPVMIVEDHDGAHHAAGHHPLDEVEVCS